MISALILTPFCLGLLAWILPSDRLRRAILLIGAALHLFLTGLCLRFPPDPIAGGWLGLDAPGRLFLALSSTLFFAAALYAVSYLRAEAGAGRHRDQEEGFLFDNEPEAIFCACLLFFLGAMTLVAASRHLGLLWVAIEATTLTSAPLIYFHRHHRSLEATWKYLLVCSVGIALALLGNFFLVIALSFRAAGPSASLALADLRAGMDGVNPAWLKAAYGCLVVGYGTKMGLAPLHTWLPDAHSESPSLVSALLSGAVLNTAFLGILRATEVCAWGGQLDFARPVLLAFGTLSVLIAAIFLFSQTDYKRMLAYSSVEHMGLLAVGLGLGGPAIAAVFFHAINHSLVKAALFLTAGNILAFTGSKSSRDVSGLFRRLPLTGLLWVLGFVAITGLPPFGLFFSKLMILRQAVAQDAVALAVILLILLAIVFMGMTTIVFRMALGPAPAGAAPARERIGFILPPALLLILALGVAGFWPDILRDLILDSARLFEPDLLSGGLLP